MKPQVLVYGNRKQPDMQWSFRTQAEKEAAFLKLFNYLKKEWKVYMDITPQDKYQYQLLQEAKDGNGRSAVKLLTLRQCAEYEEWHVEDIPEKISGALAVPVIPKPHLTNVVNVRTRREGTSISVQINLPKDQHVEFLIVPHMTTFKDWDNMTSASYFITEALETEHKRELHNAEGLRIALTLVNELRNGLHYSLNPETMSPLCNPTKVFESLLRRASATLEDWSNTPVEELKTKKRRPTTFDEAQEELSSARLTISGLEHALRKLGPEGIKMADMVMESHRRKPEVNA